MSDVDAAPAAETEIAEPTTTPLSEALTGNRHERTPEVGEDDAPAAAAPVAEPAPVSPPPPPAAQVVDPAAKPEAEQPFWYRQEAKKLRQRAEAAERELQSARQRGPQLDPPSEEEINRPVTRAELQNIQQQERLIAKVEYLGEAFADKHGEDTFEELREWLKSKQLSPNNNPMENWALAQRNPWTAAYQQYQRERIASEIGDDPAAYRAKLEEQIRSEYEAKSLAHEPLSAAPTMQRPAPPAPASTARAAAPRDNSGRFTGPAPIGQVFKHRG